jgi:hypothetical protein
MSLKSSEMNIRSISLSSRGFPLAYEPRR